MNNKFEIPICKPLTKEINLAGGNRKLVILNCTFAFVTFQLLENILILPLFFLFHILIIFATKKDEKFFDVFIKYIKYKKYYNP